LAQKLIALVLVAMYNQRFCDSLSKCSISGQCILTKLVTCAELCK